MVEIRPENDIDDDQQSNDHHEGNECEIAWLFRNGHANDQQSDDENNERVEIQPVNNQQELEEELREQLEIERYQRRRPRRQIDIEQINNDLEEFRRLNFIEPVPVEQREPAPAG
uniref:Uncharacterized protein LOC113790063 n=1 Tax=Dermatophagoides pteronyssinus TaxID=6956 RepID=A0A6P6XRP9_DERPT|nr:uncharacterized protein LOC113790063 [Dermatophagoides pteronyssinus]